MKSGRTLQHPAPTHRAREACRPHALPVVPAVAGRGLFEPTPGPQINRERQQNGGAAPNLWRKTPPSPSIDRPGAEVAQLVEHVTENDGVPSSSLGLGTIIPYHLSLITNR